MKIQKRTLVIEIIIAAFVLIAAGSLVFLIKTGKIKFSADELISHIKGTTITVSGQSINPSTKKGVANVRVTLFAQGYTPVVVTTDSRGNYKAQLVIPATPPRIGLTQNGSVNVSSGTTNRPDLIYIQQEMDGYALSSESDEFALTVPATGSTISLTQNFSTYPFINSSSSSTKTKTPTRVAASSGSTAVVSSSPLPADCISNGYSYGNGKAISGVIFCATNNKDANDLTDQTSIANQIQAMRNRTGKLNLASEVFIGDPIDTMTYCGLEPAGGCAMAGDNNIILNDAYLTNDTYTVAHEFGHLVDWANGYYLPLASPQIAPGCFINADKAGCHCYSSNKSSYLNSFDILKTNGLITGYATANQRESFAESFASYWMDINMPAAGITVDPEGQYLFHYVADNLPLGDVGGSLSAFRFNAAEITDSKFNPYNKDSIQNQNAMLYVDSFVGNAINKPIGVTLKPNSDSLSKSDIVAGKFTNNSVTIFKVVDQSNGLIGHINVDVNGTAVQTRNDSIGRAGFHTGGTAVLSNGPVGSNIPMTLAGLPANTPSYTLKTVNLIAGANPVITIRITPPLPNLNINMVQPVKVNGVYPDPLPVTACIVPPAVNGIQIAATITSAIFDYEGYDASGKTDGFHLTPPVSSTNLNLAGTTGETNICKNAPKFCPADPATKTSCFSTTISGLKRGTTYLISGGGCSPVTTENDPKSCMGGNSDDVSITY